MASSSSSSSAPKEWSCEYRGCQTKAVQMAQLRKKAPTGYPHPEDERIR